MRIGDEVQVSNYALQVKDWFGDRPSRSVVREIRDAIRAGMAPFEWRGHTHTKPPQGAQIVYVGDFDLPPDRACPCPCCSPFHAKFFRRGMIGWFPQERVVRMIGPRCFATLNPEGHESAMADWEIERKRQQDQNYLLQNLHIVRELRDALGDARPKMEAIDTVRNIVSERVERILGVDLWDHMSDGELRVIDQIEQPYTDRDGNQATRTVHQEAFFGHVSGQIMLKKHAKRLLPALDSALHAIETVPTPNKESIEQVVAGMSDSERAQYAKRLSIALNASREIWNSAQEAERFFSAANIATINGWSNHPGSPVGMYIQREGRDVKIGKNQRDTYSLLLPEGFDKVLEELPNIYGK